MLIKNLLKYAACMTVGHTYSKIEEREIKSSNGDCLVSYTVRVCSCCGYKTPERTNVIGIPNNEEGLSILDADITQYK